VNLHGGCGVPIGSRLDLQVMEAITRSRDSVEHDERVREPQISSSMIG
jgi:hypothetical protein